MKADYALDPKTAKSGSRPPYNAFADTARRERRFMPLNTPDGDWGRWARIPHGVRQVIRLGRRLAPRFA
jgi:hypothetical protein